MNQRSAIRIGVIADTHGRFDPVVRRHFKGVDYILHAGDIGDRSVIEKLEQIAPVTAVLGNVDDDEQSGFPSEAIIELAGSASPFVISCTKAGSSRRAGEPFWIASS